jgi:hypothetical protein
VCRESVRFAVLLCALFCQSQQQLTIKKLGVVARAAAAAAVPDALAMVSLNFSLTQGQLIYVVILARPYVHTPQLIGRDEETNRTRKSKKDL